MLQPPTLLIVGDPSDSLTLLVETLNSHYAVRVASNGNEALDIANADPQPAIALLSNELNGSSGLGLVCKLKQSSKLGLPIIFLSDTPTDIEEESALDLGAVDYIKLPMGPRALKARLQSHINAFGTLSTQRIQISNLTDEVAKRGKEMLDIQGVTVTAMASMAEIRDPDTVNHIRRTQHYVRTLARKLSGHSEFSGVLTLSYITTLFKTAPLHDIGKSGIPDRILLKPGRLTPEETAIMQTHTTLGRDVIENAEKSLEITVPFFTVAKEITYSHHEKWDGSGYPLGLVGNQIPVSARLMALADVYDALVTRRTYKEPMGHEMAVEVIQSAGGRHFDPHVVEAFTEVHAAFKTISIAHSDGAVDYQKKADYKAIVYPPDRD